MSAETKPKRRWMPIVLVISLALNLLVVGMAAGTAWRLKGSDHAKAPPGFGPALYRALPKGERNAMWRELSALHRKGAKERAEDFAAMSQALRAVPFDPAAVEVLLQQQTRSMVEIQDELKTRWLERVTAMSDAERQKYADRLQEVVARGHKGKKDRD